MRAVLLAVLIAALLPAIVCAQAASSPTTTTTPAQTPASGQPSSGSTSAPSSGSQSTQASTPQPVPYSPDEFPLWLRQLRRGEIITIGAFPIALILSSLSYQTVRYAQHGYSQLYAPALFGNSATPLSSGEKIGILAGAAGLSVAVALADFIIGKLSRPAAKGPKP